VPCFGKLVLSRITIPARGGMTMRKPAPHTLGVARRMRHEMLERLVTVGIVDAFQHRAHRLAPTIAEQPDPVVAKRTALGDVSEFLLEGFEPRHQAIQPRGRIPWQQHRGSAYKYRDQYNVLKSDRSRDRFRQSNDLTR
jgi:hypothetical protein